MNRVGFWVPDDLVDADKLPARPRTRERVAETDEKDRAAGNGRRVNAPVERNGKARLEVVSVQGVEDGDVLIVRRKRDRVRVRQIYAASGVSARVRHCKPVA